ncbi:MAG: helix-turn-helix transcriptional regulator, partial [Oscillospiraceae bacterium]|nr:helix-turn-helix transcriptional regulator [Oscillospiraceae bacterium]
RGAFVNTIDKITLMMKEKGYTQQQLTDTLGISKAIYSTWKSGLSKSYNKYLPEIANFLEVSEEWLKGTTKYTSELEQYRLEWDIKCVDGFDPVFDFGPIFGKRRKACGIPEVDAAEVLFVPVADYKKFENGDLPLDQQSSKELCELIGTDLVTLLKEENVFVEVIDRAAEAAKIAETQRIVVEFVDRIRIKNNLVYFAKQEGDTLKSAFDKLGISNGFYEDINSGKSLLVKELKKLTDHYGIDYMLFLNNDLTKQTGRIMAGVLREHGIDPTAYGSFRLELFDQGYCPTAIELDTFAKAMGMDILELPIPEDELLSIPAQFLNITPEELQLLCNHRKLSAKGQAKAQEYLRDISELYQK